MSAAKMIDAGKRVTRKSAMAKLFASEAAVEIANDLAASMEDQGFVPLPVSFAHGQMAGALPGPHRDPFDRMLVAQAMADGMVAAGLGTDTGGSCRIPAAFCGVVGYKPTARRVPIDGVLPLAPSLDSVGPLAPSVATDPRNPPRFTRPGVAPLAPP